MGIKLDLDCLVELGYKVFINDHSYSGTVSVGDTLTVNGINYAVLGINEDGIVVREF